MISVWTIPTSISIPIYPIRYRRARFPTCFSHIITYSTRKEIRTLKTLSLNQVCMPIPSFEHNKTINYQLTAIFEELLYIISRLNPSTPDLYPYIRHLRVEVCHILLRYLENKSRIELQIILYVKCYRYESISYVSVL